VIILEEKTMKEILKLNDVDNEYGIKGFRNKVLNKVSLTVNEGDFISIMGPSGAGKSTLLNLISTLDKPTKGEIILDGVDITKVKYKELSKLRRDNIGFIFQDFNLLDTLTAYENIALALTIRKANHKEIHKRIEEVAKSLNIEEVLNKYPYEMSGGQKQRVASARAIVTKPSLVLADEPTGALDSKSAKMLLESLEDLNCKLRATIMMVTHDAFTASYANRILFIKDGKIFNELIRGKDSRKEFFNKIIEAVSLVGGDQRDVF